MSDESQSIRKVVAEVLRTGQPGDAAYFEYLKAIDRSGFFFGPEVSEYLEKLRSLIIDLQLDATVIADDKNPNRQAHIKGRTRRMMEMTKFYETAKVLFGPYIQAHQKVSVKNSD